jgi:copper chaperone CopZ
MSMESAYFIVESINQKHDVKEIKRAIDSLHGVTSVSVNARHKLVAVDYDSGGTSYDEIEHCLNQMGFEIAADTSKINTR